MQGAILCVALAVSGGAQAKDADEPETMPGATAAPAEETGDEGKHVLDDLIPGEVTGSIALTSNYVSRGITQSKDNDPAIMGTLEYAVETGVLGTSVYIGTFGA